MTRWTSIVRTTALSLALLAPTSFAQAAPFSTDPIGEAQEGVEKQLTEKEKEVQERLKKFEEEQAKNKARVVVLQWQGSDLDYSNELLQRNIKARTTRSNAIFVPEVDLYQSGRQEPDNTLRPLDQRASVPDSTIDTVNAAVDAIAAYGWDALPEMEWGAKAAELESLADQIWFVDRKELRVPLFRLYSQIGRAAENANNSAPPYYEEVGGQPVNYYYYLAAAMASRTPDLMAELHNPDLISAIGNYKSQIEQGRFQKMTLNFELNGRFDPRKFISSYKVFIDGVETDINNEQALHEVPAGRADVYLARADDGHGLSVRVEEVRVDAQEIYSVREQARKRMGIDFQRQLMKNKNQCLPEVEDDVLTYVAIYQKLHPGQEIYIAVPEGGSVNRIHLWKWVEERGQLVKVDSNANTFPVRFVGLVGTGLTFGGASFKDPFSLDANSDFDGNPPTSLEQFQAEYADPSQFLELKPNGVPIAYEIRGHWDRLMVGVGMEYTANLQADGWVEIAPTGTKYHRVYTDGVTGEFVAGANDENRILLQTSDVKATPGTGDTATHPVTAGPLGGSQDGQGNGYRSRRFQRNIYAMIGGVLGRDAAAGFGPRGAIRAGLVNAPHAVDLTGHIGLATAIKPKKKRKADARVQALVDTDLFGGVLLPYGDTLLLLTNIGPNGELMNGGTVWGRMASGTGGRAAVVDANGSQPSLRKIGAPLPTFGFTIKAGLTF